ncbi:hypothetical protein St703_14680 [Sporolactobacillus terrae]|uniref:Uncharacterized protein n=1 Tax=Sporolactobacillus terrae TaxID=269673 RepID=A0A5K7X2A7_9BACL|nr:hypothetical protein St703_14680 [Sporolactobacillus terrae]
MRMKQPVLSRPERLTWRQKVKAAKLFVNIYRNNRQDLSVLSSIVVALRHCSIICNDESYRSK